MAQTVGLLLSHGAGEARAARIARRHRTPGLLRVRSHFVVSVCLSILLSLVLAPAAVSSNAKVVCDPTQTQPQFRGAVPQLADVVPNPGGEGGEVTTAQAYRYMDAVDDASDRVITGTLDKKSWQGRELRWAIIGRANRLGRRSLERIGDVAQQLRDPGTPPRRARQLARRYPAILWVASNVHGLEESGTDASLRVLYELADRSDCAAAQILDNALVVLLPIQNPDGRELDRRQNAFGFDMNRDWFARTQPETDAKLQMLRELPGPLFIDAHEQPGTDYFFPPNPDPIYHEVSNQSLDWINNVYGAALATEFDQQGIEFFTNDVYDLFYIGYADTVTTSGFISAGMTFEKGGVSPLSERAYEQYLAQWVSLSQAAIHKQAILRQWAAAAREALQQGQKGLLEPNEVISPGSELETEVPVGPLRHYFIRRTKQKRAEGRALVRRLQRMDVDVYKLRKGLRVPDYTPYGRRTRAERVPAGTWYVPMAQAQKHWIQAMLNEDTYVPFPFFFDATAWSQPLLFNLRGGYSGKSLRVKASRVKRLKSPAPPVPPADPPRIALFSPEQLSSSGIESSGWLRYMLERVWKIPYTSVTAADIAAGELDGYDAVLIPNGIAAIAHTQLGSAGRQALQAWVRGGGHLISWRGGTELAAQLGLTTAVLTDPTSDVPGSLFRVRVAADSPMHRGVSDTAYAYYEYDKVMRASSPKHVAVRFPPAGSSDWFVSGFAKGAAELGRTATVVDEPIGAGRATVFSVEPNFRAYTDGFQKILRNALLGGEARVLRADAAGPAATARARDAAERLTGNTTTIRLSVRPESAASAEAVLRRFGARYRVQRDPGRVAFLIRNPGGLAADQHPFARQLPGALEAAGVETIAFRAP